MNLPIEDCPREYLGRSLVCSLTIESFTEDVSFFASGRLIMSDLAKPGSELGILWRAEKSPGADWSVHRMSVQKRGGVCHNLRFSRVREIDQHIRRFIAELVKFYFKNRPPIEDNDPEDYVFPSLPEKRSVTSHESILKVLAGP